MAKWHETWAAQFGLRIGGAAVLGAAWWIGSVLFARVHQHPPQQASAAELGLCLVLALLLIAGNALFFVGPGLWKRVEIPGRWHAALSDTREFEIFTYRDRAQPAAIVSMARDAQIRERDKSSTCNPSETAV